MKDSAVLDENLRFIIIEVSKQIEDALSMLDTGDRDYVRRIAARDDYIDNLRSLIEDRCFRLIGTDIRPPKQTVAMIRAIQTTTINLERIADYCQSIVDQTLHLESADFIHQFDYKALFKEIRQAMQLISGALHSRDITRALRICRAEFTIDRLYAATLQEITDLLAEGGRNVPRLVPCLFVFNYLERIGDALLNIGEAIIFAMVGEKIKVHEYVHLEESLDATNLNPQRSNLQVHSYLETRSGCRIERVNSGGTDDPSRWVIFKEGKLNKIRRERDNLKRWNELVEGLPPRVYDYHEHDENASLLVEYLQGQTLKEIFIAGSQNEAQRALKRLIEVVDKNWESTLHPEAIASAFLSQLHERLRDVYSAHPGFRGSSTQIGELVTPSFEQLLEHAQQREREIGAPFSVFIHGDFNTDNVLFNAERGRIHFIDVYRSCQGDYVQDVSVFIVSNFRLPVFDTEIRSMLDESSLQLLRFARGFAKRHGDTTFEMRLCLGLIRSLVTSTRFEMKRSFAKEMYLRAVYLLEKVATFTSSDPGAFHFPEDILLLGQSKQVVR